MLLTCFTDEELTWWSQNQAWNNIGFWLKVNSNQGRRDYVRPWGIWGRACMWRGGLTWPVTVQLCIGICKETHTKAFKLFHFNSCPRSSFGSEQRVEAHFVPMSARIWSLTECMHKTRVQDFQRVIWRSCYTQWLYSLQLCPPTCRRAPAFQTWSHSQFALSYRRQPPVVRAGLEKHPQAMQRWNFLIQVWVTLCNAYKDSL